MSLLSIFKTKKPKAMDLPPPPVPVDEDMPELPQIEAPPEAPLEPAPLPMEHDEVAPPPEPIQIQSPEPIAEPVPIEDVQHLEVPAPMEAAEPEEEQILDRRDSISPLFVSTNDYQAILNGIGDIRKTLGDSENILAKLNEIKNAEEKVFSNWKLHMEDIERKLSYVDAVIAKNQELIQ